MCKPPCDAVDKNIVIHYPNHGQGGLTKEEGVHDFHLVFFVSPSEWETYRSFVDGVFSYLLSYSPWSLDCFVLFNCARPPSSERPAQGLGLILCIIPEEWFITLN